MPKYKISLTQAIEAVQKEKDKAFAVLMKNGSMSVEYFAPKNIDMQQPHRQDEIYVIASGSSQFYRNGEIINCTIGDVLFVPAGMEHRFLELTQDFATWVIFYGPDGGESSQ